MATNVSIIQARLEADATLVGSYNATNGYSGIAKGGIWNRKIKTTAPADTPDAFDGVTLSDVRAFRTRPSIVIIDNGERPHSQEPAVHTAYNQQVLIYFFAEANENGKSAIAAMRQRVMALIDHAASDGYCFASEDGPIVFPKYIDRYGITDDETLTATIYDYCRYQLTSRHFATV